MQDWEIAIQAALSRKADDLAVLRIGELSSFTDHFVLCNGTNVRQTQAIADAVEETLREAGVRALGIEGKARGEWILMDYGDFVLHIFTPEKRAYYDLERLWKNAPRVAVGEAVLSAGS